VRRSFSASVKELEKKQGDNIKEWQWGKMHTLTIKHAFHGADKMIDKVADIGPYPVGGDGTTINDGEYALHDYHGSIPQYWTNDYEVILGPSMRYIFDWGYPDEFKISLPAGQSGNLFSGHYKDMTDRFLQGDSYSIKTDENSIKKNKHILTLSP
jgi:penicillin amidase